MVRWRFRGPVISAVLAGCLAAAGCSAGGGGTASPGPLEKTNLVVAAVPALDSAAVYIAQQRGLFAAQGLHVTILPAISSATVIAAQEAGKFDVTSGNYVSYILADASRNAKLEVLAPGSVMQPNNQMIMVPPGSPVQTISQLQGKTVAVNATGNIGTVLIDSVLSDSSIVNPTAAVRLRQVDFPKMASALAHHQVAAAWMPEPFITQAEEQAGAVPLADTDQGSTQSIPISGYVVTSAWLKKYPHTAMAFRNAILQAQSIAATNPGAVQQGMRKFAGVPADTSAITALPEFPTANNEALIQRLANLMLNFGMLNQKFDAATMFTNVPKGS
jgi:NitT/TauT family transport system substrate-binding protein